MTSARAAFLILAHDNPALLARLVDRLCTSDAAVFVHIDAKVAIEPFEAILAPRPHVTLLKRAHRKTVHWGGYSMIRAELELLNAALASAPDAKRLFLLSGVDYPLKPVREIIAATANNIEYVRVDRVLDPAGEDLFDLRGYRFGLMDNSLLNPRTAPTIINRAIRRGEGFVRRTYPGGSIYYGSAWWALTREAAEYVVAQSGQRPATYFRWTAIPEEQYFQTILKASPFAINIYQDATRSDTPPRNLHALHYIRFIDGQPSPATPTRRDLDELLGSGALFTRKVNERVSSTLLDELDRCAS